MGGTGTYTGGGIGAGAGISAASAAEAAPTVNANANVACFMESLFKLGASDRDCSSDATENHFNLGGHIFMITSRRICS